MKIRKSQIFFIALLAACLLLATACAEGGLSNGEEENAVDNNGEVLNQTENQTSPNNQTSPQNQTQRPDPDLVPQHSFSFSSGGGEGSSQDYRARIIVGAPTPAGSGHSENFRAVMGAGPVQHTQAQIDSPE